MSPIRTSAPTLHTVIHARARAEKILPRVVFGFLDGGSGDEITLRGNRRAWQDIVFRPRAAAAPASTDLSTTIFGQHLDLPLVLSPIGGLRLLHADGDRATMRAANAAGTTAILSTNSGTPMEEVTSASNGPSWFQLYFRGGRPGAEAIVERAQRAGFSALFVTLDVSGGIPVERVVGEMNKLGRLRGDTARDAAMPSTLSVRNSLIFAPQLARHPRWTAGYIRDGVPTKFTQQDDEETARAIAGAADDRPMSLGAGKPRGKQVPMSIPEWEDLKWIRETWKGPLVAKGIGRGDDARRAVDLGVDGILVSNHGGRQLDTGLPTAWALPEVRAAVGPDLPLLVDGGIRRGGDIVKAIALGANVVSIGRPYAYGLAAGGQAGVARILEIFGTELLQTMRALGLKSLDEIDATSIDTARSAPFRHLAD